MSSGAVPHERRYSPRVPVATEIQVAAAGGIRDAILVDVSRTGARFMSPHPVGVAGDTIEIVLPSPQDKIALRCEILRAHRSLEGYVVAVRFVAVEPSTRAALDALMTLLIHGGGAA